MSALAVLQNATTKWSAPRLFNDPFDLPSSLNYSFTGEDAAHALVDELLTLAYGRSPIQGDPNNKFIRLAALFRILPNKPSQEEFRRTLSESIDEVSQEFAAFKDRGNQKLSGIRDKCAVFCVTETNDNLLMWAHYAANHTGCVFRFRCVDGHSPRLQYAQKVRYVDAFPEIVAMSDYVKKLIGQQVLEPTPDELTDTFLLTKSQHWSYEQEWRAVFGLEDVERGFDLQPMSHDDIDEIYIGCKADEEFVRTIVDLVESRYPDVSIFKARINAQAYSLFFERMR